MLQLVHSDVMGPLPVQTIGGSKFLLTFVDDYSRYSEVVIMKKKSEVAEHFINFQAKCERLHGKLLKSLQTDNGTEYINNTMKAHIKKAGMEHQRSCVYTSQQHGRAKRLNQTLAGTVRCLLIQSGLGLLPKIWGEAMMYASYIRNRCRSTVIDNKTPLELWLNKELQEEDINMMKTFGCEAWAVKNKPGKLTNRGISVCVCRISTRSKRLQTMGYRETRYDHFHTCNLESRRK